MKNIMYNAGYFFKEAKTMLRLNMASNILSLLCTGLIFFILAMVVSGWWVTGNVIEVIQGEAEINVYFDESTGSPGASQLAGSIRDIGGVLDVRVVGREEAYNRMVKILGKEAKVLEYFDDNPFSSFIEVKIDLGKMDEVIDKLEHTAGVEYVRDNRDVLERIRDIAGILKLLGYLVAAAVGISTLAIISHIIRLGIYNNREQINTLRLLGAPEWFTAFPFLLEGLLLTLGGGILAAAITTFTLNYVYARMAGPLPFIPLPPLKALSADIAILVISLSAVLGVAGSLFGLSSSKNS